MELLERARALQSSKEAYELLLELSLRLSELKHKKATIELELAIIKASVFEKDHKLSSEKIEYSALTNQEYKEKSKALIDIESEMKLLQNFYDIISKSFLKEVV